MFDYRVILTHIDIMTASLPQAMMQAIKAVNIMRRLSKLKNGSSTNNGATSPVTPIKDSPDDVFARKSST